MTYIYQIFIILKNDELKKSFVARGLNIYSIKNSINKYKYIL